MRRSIYKIPAEGFERFLTTTSLSIKNRLITSLKREESKMRKADEQGNIFKADEHEMNIIVLRFLINMCNNINKETRLYVPKEIAILLMIKFAKSDEEEPSDTLKDAINEYLKNFSFNAEPNREIKAINRLTELQILVVHCVKSCDKHELSKLDNAVHILANNF